MNQRLLIILQYPTNGIVVAWSDYGKSMPQIGERVRVLVSDSPPREHEAAVTWCSSKSRKYKATIVK